MNAEKYDSRIGRDLADFLRGVKAAHDRHGQIKNHRIRRELHHLGDCLSAILRLSTNLPLIAARKQDAHTYAHNFVVVRN